jgi:hypothetical protein
VGTYCCAQFIVHRSRILQHPISFWRLALKITIDMNDCSHFEHLWHIFSVNQVNLINIKISPYGMKKRMQRRKDNVQPK